MPPRSPRRNPSHDDSDSSRALPTFLAQGTVVGHYGVAVDVRIDQNDWPHIEGAAEKQGVLSIRIPRKAGHVVGDRVSLYKRSDGYSLHRHERRNSMLRRTPEGTVVVMAANLDAVGIVAAVKPPPKEPLLDRAMITARALGIKPFLIVNKIDLDDEEDGIGDALSAIYEDEMPTFLISAAEDIGLDDLRTFIKEAGIVMLMGASGVGKSSLTNALIPEASLSVGALSDFNGQGCHTTTTATLHPVSSGGYLVDTPGVREFGLPDLDPLDVAYFAFNEAVEQNEIGPCRFRDCLHDGAPGCAIAQAVEDDLIASWRYESYCNWIAELKEQRAQNPQY